MQADLLKGFSVYFIVFTDKYSKKLYHQSFRGESRKQKLHSSWRMMTIPISFRGGKRIDPRPRRQMRSGKLAEASCGQPLPSTLQLKNEGFT